MIWTLYNGFIRLFVVGLHIHAIFNSKSKKGVKGRRQPWSIQEKKGQRIWVHCASLGEFEQGRAVIERLYDEGIEIVLTFFSPSGFEVMQNYPCAVWVGYLPFDTKKKTEQFVDAVAADAVIFVKYEFWWNTLRAIVSRRTPLILISVVLGKKHYLFRPFARIFQKILKAANTIYTVEEQTIANLASVGFDNMVLAGDTRINSILNQKNKNVVDLRIKEFCGDRRVIVFGSTYSIEHKEIVRSKNRLTENYVLLIFPHEIKPQEIETLQRELGKDSTLYSQYQSSEEAQQKRILIIDRIGLLKDAYRFAHLAYVGGGLSGGLHNTLEPFVYKIPLVFGSNFHQFPEAEMLAQQDFVKVVDDPSEIYSAMLSLDKLDHKASIAQAYSLIFEQNKDTAIRIAQEIKALI